MTCQRRLMDGWMDGSWKAPTSRVGIVQCDGMDLFAHIKHLNFLLTLPPTLPLHKQLNSMGRILKKKQKKLQRSKNTNLSLLSYLTDRQFLVVCNFQKSRYVSVLSLALNSLAENKPSGFVHELSLPTDPHTRWQAHKTAPTKWSS